MTSTLNIEPSAVAAGTLDLDGEELALRSIDIDGVTLSEGSDYALTEDGISLLKLPLSKFALTTTVAIKPQDNTQLSGNYARAQTICTPSLPSKCCAFRGRGTKPGRPMLLPLASLEPPGMRHA